MSAAPLAQDAPAPAVDAAAAADPERCLNCGTALGVPRPRYCGHCGQETHVRPPRFSEFVQQFGGAYFSTEGALWRTLGLLLFRPGELTRRYLAGRRKHYVLPLRLYLTISLLALVALRLLVPVNFNVGSDDAIMIVDRPNEVFLSLGEGREAAMRDGRFVCEGLPAWVCTRLERRLGLDPKSLRREIERVPERFFSHWGTAMFLLLPVFALLLKGVHAGSGLRYTEHLVYALHLHSFWFAALLLALLPLPAVGPAMALLVPLYTLVAAHRVYGGRWIGTLLRSAVVGLVYMTILGIALGIVAVWAFFS